MLRPSVGAAPNATVVELWWRHSLAPHGASGRKVFVGLAQSAQHDVTLFVFGILSSAKPVDSTFSFAFAFAFAEVGVKVGHELIAGLTTGGV